MDTEWLVGVEICYGFPCCKWGKTLEEGWLKIIGKRLFLSNLHHTMKESALVPQNE